MVARIDALRQCFLAAKDLSDPFERFDTDLVPLPDFFSHSHSGTHPVLSATVDFIAKRVRPDIQLIERVMYEVPGTGFWHGMAYSAHEFVFFYYFDSIAMGLVGMQNPFDPRGLAHYLRFSAITPVGYAMPTMGARASA